MTGDKEEELKIVIKAFEEMNLQELYQVLRLRSQVFVVEQNCVYQDIDGKDQKAVHVLGFRKSELVAYTRCFSPGFYCDEAAIGRVVVTENARGNAFGHGMLRASVLAVKENFNSSNIKLSAQTYLISFYESHGFRQIGEGYLEDGIPHIAMLKTSF